MEFNLPPDTEFIVVQPYLDDGEKVGVGTLLTAEEIGIQRAYVMEKKGWIARAADLLDDDDVPTLPKKAKAAEALDASELVALGLSKAIIKALTAAGLTTRESIAAYAEENDGLEKAGLGPGQEEKVFAALGGVDAPIVETEGNESDGDKTEDDGAK